MLQAIQTVFYSLCRFNAILMFFMTLLSVIIPTYNERGNIHLLTDLLSKAFQNVDYEVIFVDDNSPDGTADAIRSLSDFGKRTRIIERSGKQGLASAIVTGLKQATGDWILVMDGDLSHPPEVARRLFESRDDADLVVASRSNNGAHNWPIHRNLISKTAEFLCRPLIGTKTVDPLSGFFLVRKQIFDKTKTRVKGYKILLNLLYDQDSIKIKDVPYTFGARNSGETKLDSGEIVNYVFDLVRLVWK